MTATLRVLITSVLAFLSVERSDASAATPLTKSWPSPDGSMVIAQTRIRTLEEDPTAQYALTFHQASRTPKKLLEFGRSVTVFWDSDNRHFVVTDYIGSNISDCYLYDVHHLDRRIDMWDKVPASSLRKDAHLYVTCGGWSGPGRVPVRVKGHTDLPPVLEFDEQFRYELATGRVTQTSSSEHAPQ